MNPSIFEWLWVLFMLVWVIVGTTAVNVMEERRLGLHTHGKRSVPEDDPIDHQELTNEPSAAKSGAQTMTPIEDRYTPYVEYYKLAYDLALKGLDQQQETLDGIRQRASVLLAAASLVTGFLGGASLPAATQPALPAATLPAPLGGAGWVAIGLFALTVVALLYVIRPREGWKFLPSGREMVKSYLNTKPARSLAQTYYGLAVEMDRAQAANRVQLNRMLNAIDAAVILIGVTIVAWIVEFAQ